MFHACERYNRWNNISPFARYPLFRAMDSILFNGNRMALCCPRLSRLNSISDAWNETISKFSFESYRGRCENYCLASWNVQYIYFYISQTIRVAESKRSATSKRYIHLREGRDNSGRGTFQATTCYKFFTYERGRQSPRNKWYHRRIHPINYLRKKNRRGKKEWGARGAKKGSSFFSSSPPVNDVCKWVNVATMWTGLHF